MTASPWVLGVIAVLAGLVALWWFWWRRVERKGWSIGPLVRGKNYSRGVTLSFKKIPHAAPVAAQVVWSITINAADELDGVTIARGALREGIRLRCRVTRAGLYPSERPSDPPVLTAYFQRAGDDWSGRGKFATYRWYSVEGFPLTPGEHVIDLPFDPALWASVNGPTAAEGLESQFRAALAAPGRVGLGFGWLGGRMHGVETASPVTIELLEWSAQ